jgi:hypothetical protein
MESLARQSHLVAVAKKGRAPELFDDDEGEERGGDDDDDDDVDEKLELELEARARAAAESATEVATTRYAGYISELEETQEESPDPLLPPPPWSPQ